MQDPHAAPSAPATPAAIPVAALNEAPARQRASAPLGYPLEPPAPGGAELVRIAEGVLWARVGLAIPLNHINVYLLHDGDGWVLVDTGLHHELSFQAWERIAQAPELEGLPFKALICTHYHYDHAGMAHWLCSTYNIPLYMTRSENNTMRTSYRAFPAGPLPASFTQFYGQAGASIEVLQRMGEALRQDPFIPQAHEQYIRLRGGDVLHIGQRKWTVLIGSGHSPEHACLYSIDTPEQPLLLAGDQLISRISSNVPVTPFEPLANPLQDWLDALDMLEQLDEKTWVLPAHQGIFTGIRLRTQELRQQHHAQFAAIEGVLQEQGAITAAAIMAAIFPRLRNPIDQLLALGETMAHLNWLLAERRISRRLDSAANQHLYTLDPQAPAQQLMGVLRVNPI